MTEPVATDREVTVYPLPFGAVLDGQHWVPMHYERLLQSDWMCEAIRPENREAAGFGAAMWFRALKQDPAGTLPDDDAKLAVMAGLGMDVADWRTLRPFALRGWNPVLIADEDGEVVGRRLAHAFVTSIVMEAMKRKRGAQARRQSGVDRNREHKVRQKLRSFRFIRSDPSPEHVATIAAWLRDSDLVVSDDNVRRAWDSLIVGREVNHLK